MSGPIIWIFIPILGGTVLYILQKNRLLVNILGIFITVNLVLTAWAIPIRNISAPEFLPISLNPVFQISNFQFVIRNSDRVTMMVIFALTVFMMIGSIASGSQRRSVPIFMLADAFLVAAFSFQPTSYGILFFIPIVFLFTFVLSPPGDEISTGLLKFIAFQIIGITAMILAAGIMLNDPHILENEVSIDTVTMLCLLGFIFLFSVFPVFTWIIKTTETQDIYITSYVLIMIFGGYVLYFTQFNNQYGWLFSSSNITALIRVAGMAMVITSGIWILFERNAGRLFGYGAVIAMGNTLLTFLVKDSMLPFLLISSYFFALSIWALGLTVLKNISKSLDFESIQGMGRSFPISSLSIIVANVSIAGLPLLASFPGLIVLWDQIDLLSSSEVIINILSSVCLLVGGLRTMRILLAGNPDTGLDQSENLSQQILLVAGIIGLLFLGIFPQWFIQFIQGILIQ